MKADERDIWNRTSEMNRARRLRDALVVSERYPNLVVPSSVQYPQRLRHLNEIRRIVKIEEGFPERRGLYHSVS